MAVLVVDLLEVVEVDQHHARPGLPGACSRRELLDGLVEAAPVRHAGERIHGRLHLDQIQLGAQLSPARPWPTPAAATAPRLAPVSRESDSSASISAPNPAGVPRLAMRPLLACSAAVNSVTRSPVALAVWPTSSITARSPSDTWCAAFVAASRMWRRYSVHQLVAQRHAVGARRIDLGAQVVVAAGEIVVPDGVGDGVQGAGCCAIIGMARRNSSAERSFESG